VVECSDPDGHTVWLAEFLQHELQLVPNPSFNPDPRKRGPVNSIR
jgi:hypothetical protein